MIKENIQKMKDIIKLNTNDNGNNKKKIENLVTFIIILIVTVIIINFILKGDNKEEKKEDYTILAKTENKEEINNETNNDLEQRLENILEKIEGVGRVNVLITYSESSKTIAMYNEDTQTSDTNEEDSRWRK